MVKLSKDEGFSSISIVLIVAIGMIIIGALVPVILWQIAKTKISEPMKNLAAICKAQEAYKAKNNTYHLCKESPANGGTDDKPDPWVDEGTPGVDAFADIGFKPEGPVRYRYSVTKAAENSFTVTATGDLDEDGETSMLIVIYPHRRYPEPMRSGDRW